MTSDEYGYDIPEAQDIHKGGGVLSAISDSWSRCREFGLRASGKPVEAVLSEERFRMVMEQNESIRHFVLPEMELLYNQIAGTNFMVAYADRDGVVLDPIQDDDFRLAKVEGCYSRSVWMKATRPNALGLANSQPPPSHCLWARSFFSQAWRPVMFCRADF